jgi:RibD C-terminal domain
MLRQGYIWKRGANATLVSDEVEAFVRRLKLDVEGDIHVAGPELAGSLSDLGLIDEYHLYFRPFVLGRGKPYFAGARPPLRPVATDPVGEDAVRLTFAPAWSHHFADGRGPHRMLTALSTIWSLLMLAIRFGIRVYWHATGKTDPALRPLEINMAMYVVSPTMVKEAMLKAKEKGAVWDGAAWSYKDGA